MCSTLRSDYFNPRQDRDRRPAMEYKVFCIFAIALIVGSFSSANGQAALTEEQCSVQPATRLNCGAPGIGPTDCYNKGCCFDNSQPNEIWCYYPQTADNECSY